MDLVERAKRILLQPGQEWQVINKEAATPVDLYRSYIVPLAAIGPVASVIGLSVVGVFVPFFGTYRVSFGTAVSHALVSYVLTLAGVYALAMIINAFAPTFAGEKSQIQALKVAAYASTAAWLAGVFGLIPALSILGILGLYSFYLLYLGLPTLMKAPQEKALGYTAVVIVAAIVVFAVISIVSGAFVRYPSPSMK
jgi:Yip1-like protein